MSPPRYLWTALAAALAAAAVLAGLNWWASRPAVTSRLNFVMERKTAALLAKGQPVILTGQLNEWMLRWHLANRLPEAPEVAVLGSSHSLGVSASVLGATRSVNFSISGSSMADYLVTSGILETREIRPARWVVFVDPWLFDGGADYGAWYLWADELLRMEQALSDRGPTTLYPVFSDNRHILAKRQPARYALDPLLRAFDGALEEVLLRAYPPDDTHAHAQVMAADGSLSATADRHPPTPDAVEALALRQFTERPDRHRYGTYPHLDANLRRYFERWVQRRREEGSEVWLVLPPYHPAIYSRIVQTPGNQLRTVENLIRDFAGRSGTPLIGSYDPVRAGLPAELFYDGDHLGEKGLKQLLAPFREAAPAVPVPPATR